MKIAYYCQHVLGVGHFHRSLEICRTLSSRNQVTLISGGPEMALSEVQISLLQLPGLKMDDQFKNLSPCDSALDLDQVKQERTQLLLDFADKHKPDCLILELYPFGRKAFRFELDPLLEALAATSCKIFCSVRDILVEKTEGREKFEQRAVETVNNYFDGLLIHSDPAFIPFEKTFGKTESITVPVHYTGFISPVPSDQARQTLRDRLGLRDRDKLIVCSIGSGSVGSELVFAAAEAFADMKVNDCVMQIFTGPYLAERSWQNLLAYRQDNLHIERFSDNFIDWLAAADLSISMAGYNTFMNVLSSGVPALMYPFSQNREQRLRIEMLGSPQAVTLLKPEDLTRRNLANLITKGLKKQRTVPTINIDGARQTQNIIETESIR